MSCSFGQFDIAGFPKPHAWWYVIAWANLCTSSSQPGSSWTKCAEEMGVPLLANTSMVRILDLPDFPVQTKGPDSAAAAAAAAAAVAAAAAANTVVSAVATTPRAELLLDGRSLGAQKVPASTQIGGGTLSGLD